MKNILPIILIGAAVLCSCEKRFELHPENYSKMIRLQCVADACNDSVYIFPSVCIPALATLHDRNRAPHDLQINDLGIEVDGEYREAVLTEYKVLETVYDEGPVDEEWQPPHEEWVTKYRWAVPGKVPEGSKLKIKAAAYGAEPVYGETVVPSRPEVSLVCAPYEYTEGIGDDRWTTQYLRIKVDITDKANDTGYYAIQIIAKTRNVAQYTDEAKAMGYEDYDNTVISGVTPDNISQSAFDDFEDESGITIGYDGYRLSYYYAGPLRIYQSGELEGQEFFIRSYPDRIIKGNPQVIKHENRTQYQVRVYRISPEIYRFAKAYNLEGNELSEAGLAPVNFTYSNIVGGSGYFGAFTRFESEWVANPFVTEYDEEKYY